MSACSQHATHQAGSKHGGMGGVCTHCPGDVRANPRAGMPGGCVSRAERAAAHHSSGNAGRGFAAAERSSWAHVVCCCVGQAKVVNGATKAVAASRVQVKSEYTHDKKNRFWS